MRRRQEHSLDVPVIDAGFFQLLGQALLKRAPAVEQMSVPYF